MVNPFSQKEICTTLDEIIQKMILTVESSKKEVFEFVDALRNEYEVIKLKMGAEQNRIEAMIKRAKQLDMLSPAQRGEALKQDENINLYSEKEKCISYQYELEQRLEELSNQIERAEALVTQINIISNYLTSDFQDIDELTKGACQKQQFGLRIIEAQEEERKRLSREIHDGPAQTLAHLLIRSDLLERMGRKQGLNALLDEVKVMREYIRDALYEVRRIIYDLRPMALDDLGLIPTLKKYLRTIEEYNKIKIVFEYYGKRERVPTNYEVACFRLIQEAVQNVCKHANATKIEVTVEIMREQIVFSIIDNGSGFNIQNKKENSFGIVGMKERVDLLNGKIRFHSVIGKGTSIWISIPLANNL
ncbi:MAG: histidine kinase [Bacillaceae bacterium]